MDFRRWQAILLASILIPVAFLTTFRLTGVLQEPISPERVTLAAVTYSLERPGGLIVIDERVESGYTDGKASVGLGFHVDLYEEDSALYSGHDYVQLIIAATANVSGGFVYSMNVNFSLTDSSADVTVRSPFLDLNNLKSKKTQYSREHDTRQVYFQADALNYPQNASLRILADWIFFDFNYGDHWITVTLETTYFNGTAFRRTDVPIKLGMLLDYNNHKVEASTIMPGTYEKLYIGGYDASDFYEIYLTEGQKIDVNAWGIGSPQPVFYLFLYDPLWDLRNDTNPSYSPSLSYVASMTGFWLIEVRIDYPQDYGYYTLSTEVE